MFTNVSREQASALRLAVSRAGLDADAVQVYIPPPPPIPPAALVATAVGQVLLVITATLAAVSAQIRILRSYLGRLLAIGLPPAWVRHVLFLQLGFLVSVSTLLGIIIALIPTTVLAQQVSGFVLSVPWSQMVTLLACIYLAIALATIRATATLRSRGGLNLS